MIFCNREKLAKTIILAALFVFLARNYSSANEISPTSTMAESDSGSAADLELRIFGAYLTSAAPKKLSAMDMMMFNTVLALYQISGLHKESLRLCDFLNVSASNQEQIDRARQCKISALTRLEKYPELEELIYTGDVPNSSQPASIQAIGWWGLFGERNLNQGNLSVAIEAYKQRLDVIDTMRKMPPPRVESSTFSELNTHLESTLKSNLDDAEIESLNILARIAFSQFRFREYEAYLDRLLKLPLPVNAWGIIAIDHCDYLLARGKREYATQLAGRALLELKADAGFRDQSEPLTNFLPNPSAVQVLGSERTNSIFVVTWLRLARAYLLLGRVNEADNLTSAALILAKKYSLEMEDSSSLVALVEEMQAEIAMQKGEYKAAANFLRQARQRVLNKQVTVRTQIVGRRHAQFESQLLNLNTKLLLIIARDNENKKIGEATGNEILELLKDFGSSRAEISSVQAAQSAAQTDADSRALLEQEGNLIDELIDVRGRISSFAVRHANEASSLANLQQEGARIAGIYSQLRAIKQLIPASGLTVNSKDNGAEWSRLKANIGPKDAYWQWITYAGRGFVFLARNDGVWLSALSSDLEGLKSNARDLHQTASSREAVTISDLAPYPRDTAKSLYNALFGPLADKASDADHWIVSPAQMLDRIPWAALIATSEAGNEEWLVERVALTVAPSWRSFNALMGRSFSSAPKMYLGVAGPSVSPAILPNKLDKRGAIISSLPGLKSVQPVDVGAFDKDVKELATLFPDTRKKILLGQQATKKNLLGLSLNQYRIVHLSTHGYLSEAVVSGIGPSLGLYGSEQAALSERLLSATEIARIKLDADFVILSACDTSAPDGQMDSEGFSGLTSAFLSAGARNVIGSLWPVDSGATEALFRKTVTTYASKSNESISFALRDGMRSVSSEPQTQHPYFWAGFVAVGR